MCKLTFWIWNPAIQSKAMHKHTPQDTECFNWKLLMEILYVRIIAGVHAHLWYLRAITKPQVSERRHMASFAYILQA